MPAYIAPCAIMSTLLNFFFCEQNKCTQKKKVGDAGVAKKKTRDAERNTEEVVHNWRLKYTPKSLAFWRWLIGCALFFKYGAPLQNLPDDVMKPLVCFGASLLFSSEPPEKNAKVDILYL